MVTMYTSIDDPALVADLRHGAVGILPTDTVYGLVCLASDKNAVERLYEIKRRDGKTGVLIAANISQLVDIGFRKKYLIPAQSFWPNSVSIEIPTTSALVYLDKRRGTIAIRVPNDKRMQKLLAQTGPLLTTSANHPNEPTAVNVTEAMAYFGDSVDFYVDGGDFSGRPASTLIRIVDDVVEVLRPGSIEISETGQIIAGESKKGLLP